MLERPPVNPAENLREVRSALADIHLAALALPLLEPDESGPEEPAVDASHLCTARLTSFPVALYWDQFDPLKPEPEAPVANSIADDLRDIYVDLKRGLTLYQAGALVAACWSWRFSFEIHWGEHLVGLQRALYLMSRDPCG